MLLNAEVFAPQAIGRRHVLVAGEQIAWIGEDAPDALAAFDIDVHDLEGRRLVPGLIDCHVHLTGGGGEGGFKTKVPGLTLSQLTQAGITTVIGVLGTDDSTRSTAALLAAARGLTEEGLSAYCLTGGYHIPPTTLTGSVRDDIVHLDRVLGVGEIALSDSRSSQPTLDELLRVAGDAYVGGLLAGKAGLTHLHMGNGERGLSLVREALDRSELPPRVFHPTHVNRRPALFADALELTARGCSIDITASTSGREDEDISAPDAVRRYLDSGRSRELLTISSDAGGSLPSFDADGEPCGRDVGRPESLNACLTGLLEAGHELETVLPFFTANVARLFFLASKGRIEVGRDADLIVLDANGRASSVMARGRWHVRNGELLVSGTYEQTNISEVGFS